MLHFAFIAATASPRQVSQHALILTLSALSEPPSNSSCAGCACSGQRTAAIFADICSFTCLNAASSILSSSLPAATSCPPILNLICIAAPVERIVPQLGAPDAKYLGILARSATPPSFQLLLQAGTAAATEARAHSPATAPRRP